MSEKDRLSVIITKGGDKGTTSLGGGERVSKDAPRIEAYGAVDELNSVIGLVRNHSDVDSDLDSLLSTIQHDLFTLGGELCFTPEGLNKYKVNGVEETHVTRLEEAAASYNEELAPLQEFILPAGPHGAAELHLARTVCRRAERRVVALTSQETVRFETIRYLNRLSDLLFILSRRVLHDHGVDPVLWKRDS